MIDLISGDCLRRMKEIVDGSVDLTVTSPRAYWDGIGLPPAGVECECWHQGISDRKHWVRCDVIGPYGDYVVCAPNCGGFYGFDANELRPIRTKEEQEQHKRDKVINAAYQRIMDMSMCMERPLLSTLVAAYDAGILIEADNT